MKINVYSIPTEGKKIHLSLQDDWIRHAIKSRAPEIRQDAVQIKLDLSLYRHDQNVYVSGQGEMSFPKNCDRCGENYCQELELNFTRHLIPISSVKHLQKDADESEVELQQEDLDFGTYQHDEIHLDELIGEEILLAMPMRFLCQEDCKGLCPHCGKNLNLTTCQCHSEEEKSPFAVLKKISLKNKTKD